MPYPATGGDARAGTPRLVQTYLEKELLGRTDPGNAPLGTGPDSGRVRAGRVVQPGVRGYLKVSNRFAEGITPRQRRLGRVRIARSWGRMLKAMEDSGMTMAEFVETLDAEELVRGKLKDKNGDFAGRNPSWVPREFHRACIRELMRRGQKLWQGNYLQAIEAMTQIAIGKGVGTQATPGERIKAAQFVIERIEGKIPERVQVVEDSPWQVIIEDIVAEVPDAVQADAVQLKEIAGFPQGEVVDGEIVPDPPPRRPAARRVRKGRS
jgi:hypothetical protein